MLIKGGQIIDPASNRQGVLDVRVEQGKIVDVGPDLRATAGEMAISAEGKIVSPGFVDIHAHFRDPGQTHKEDLFSGSRAAAAGGYTTVVCMANTVPAMDSAARVRTFYGRAAETAAVNLYTCASVTYGLAGQELTDFAALAEAGAVGFSDDGNPVANAALVRLALERAGVLGLPVISHCGDLSLVADTIVNEGAAARRLGLRGMPAAAEEIQVARDILLARLTGQHVHIQHVSSAIAVSLIRAAKKEGIRVTAEATPHHFSLTDEALISAGANAKMNPPLRTAEDVAAVCRGLADGTLDVIATDHAPHTKEEKAAGLCDAPCGVVGLETAFGLVWTRLVLTNVLTPMAAISKLTCMPAAVMGLQKGTLAVGADADITIVDPDARWLVEPARFFSKSQNTPFTGQELTGRVTATICRGRLVYWQGQMAQG